MQGGSHFYVFLASCISSILKCAKLLTKTVLLYKLYSEVSILLHSVSKKCTNNSLASPVTQDQREVTSAGSLFPRALTK